MQRDVKVLLCCSIACRLWHVFGMKVFFCARKVLCQSPTCLLKTGRLADCHGKCFAPLRWRCSLLKQPERVSPDSASTRITLALPKLHSYTPHTICVILSTGRASTIWRTKTVHVAWTWALAFSKTRESGAWGRSWILLSAAAVVTTSRAVPQREDDVSLQVGDEPRPGAVFLKAAIFICL